MIKTKYLVPEVYYDRSRDFQLMGRTYDVIFNYLKTNTDTISNNPLSNDSDKKLINLVASTLGFKQLHNYNTDQLKAICSVYQLAIRNKGNLKSLQIVLDTLLHTAGIDEPIEVEIIGPVIQIMVPPELTDLTLFYDMLDYILPAGCSCQIIKQLKVTTDVTTDTVYEEVTYNTQGYNAKFAYSPQYDQWVAPSDVDPGRNDNMTIMGYDVEATKWDNQGVKVLLGRRDAGDWSYSSSNQVFTLYKSTVVIMPSGYATGRDLVNNTEYTNSGAVALANMPDKTYQYHTSGKLYIKDTSCTTVAQLMAKLKDKWVRY